MAHLDPLPADATPGLGETFARFAGRAAGCRYCTAHSLLAAGISGVGREKIERVLSRGGWSPGKHSG
jgi:hypothetical protein